VIFILAQSGGFDFGSFQQGFHDVWNFVFPNALVLCVSIWIGRYVGRITLPWLRIPWDRLQRGLKQVSTFLSESNLFGSKLLPAVVLLGVGIAALDIFQVVRFTAESILPPNIVTKPETLYSTLATRDLLLKIFAKDQSIQSEWDLYRRITARGEELERDPKAESRNYWAEKSGDWWRYGGDIKLLALVALISCAVGLARGHWGSLFRLLLVAIPLCLGFAICTAKFLFAREQQAFAVLDTMKSELRDVTVESPADLLRKRVELLGKQNMYFHARIPLAENDWWELRWVDASLCRGWIAPFGSHRPRAGVERDSIWTEKELHDAGLDTDRPPPVLR
jgi:hypothetical protein